MLPWGASLPLAPSLRFLRCLFLFAQMKTAVGAGGSTAAAQDGPFAVAFKIGWNRARRNPRPRRPGEGIPRGSDSPCEDKLTKARVARRRTGHVVPASPEIHEDRDTLSGKRTRPAKPTLLKVSAAGNQHIP